MILTLGGAGGHGGLRASVPGAQVLPVFGSDPDTRRFLDSGELDIWGGRGGRDRGSVQLASLPTPPTVLCVACSSTKLYPEVGMSCPVPTPMSQGQ